MINDTGVTKIGTAFIPIVIYECNRDKTDNQSIDIILSDAELSIVAKSAIKNAAYTKFSSLEWSHNSSSTQEIKSEFSKLLSASSKSLRIKDLTMSLYQSGNYLTI
jgi:Tfp pilus assembly protein PilV